MAGIYIHIPFCKQACSYCNFHFSTSTKRKSELVDAILLEAQLRSNYLKEEIVETIYFGGGTPSLLTEQELNSLLNGLSKNYNLSQELEITLEANPDDLNRQKLSELKKAGVNRLSVGIQSFHEADLKLFNRSHNAEEALSCIKSSQDIGFENLNIDLIFGAQTTSDTMWEENLKLFFNLKIPHLSSYSLTVEEKTAMNHWINSEREAPIDQDKNHRQYQMLVKAIKVNNYQQYELSNFCESNNYSKHNTSYWFGKKYLGLGPSAHSYNGKSRQWNVSNNLAYIKAINKNEDFFEIETLSETNQFHEFLITRLRTKWGINFKDVNANFSQKIADHFYQQITRLDPDTVEIHSEYLSIPQDQLFLSDEVVRQLMISK